MRKKITKPDGTVEEFEGTAEELAELENRLRDGKKHENRGKKKNVLLGKELERQVQECIEKLEKAPNINLPLVPDKFMPKLMPIGPSIEDIYKSYEGTCAIEQFFKANPNASSCMMVCYCPKCAVMCRSYDVCTNDADNSSPVVYTEPSFGSVPMGGTGRVSNIRYGS